MEHGGRAVMSEFSYEWLCGIAGVEGWWPGDEGEYSSAEMDDLFGMWNGGGEL